MGALDLGAIENSNQKLNEFDSDIVQASKLPEGTTDIRIMPPSASMNKLFYVVRETWWFETAQGKRTALSIKTFDPNGIDVCEQEVEAAKLQVHDYGLQNMVNDKKKCAKQVDFLIPFVQLITRTNAVTRQLESVEIAGTKVKFLAVPKTLLNDLTKCVLDRFVMPDITDRVNGFNIVITKWKESGFQKYKAHNWPQPMQMPESLYAPTYDPYVLLRAEDAPDAYKRSLVRYFLYGEPLMDKKDAKAGAQGAYQDPRFSQPVQYQASVAPAPIYPTQQVPPQTSQVYAAPAPVYQAPAIVMPTIAAQPVAQVQPAQTQYPFNNAQPWPSQQPTVQPVAQVQPVAPVIPTVQQTSATPNFAQTVLNDLENE